jgi:ubiquitin C
LLLLWLLLRVLLALPLIVLLLLLATTITHYYCSLLPTTTTVYSYYPVAVFGPNIQKEPTLRLVLRLRGGMQIFVKTLTGKTITLDVEASEVKTTQRTPEVKTITLDVEASDTVLSIKTKIQEMENITPHQQHLVFMEESLGNNRAISDYNIQEGAVLVLDKEWGMQIVLKTIDNETILMDVMPVETVGFFKGMIQHKEGITPDQQVMISTVGLMEDERKLSDYNIQKWDTL